MSKNILKRILKNQNHSSKAKKLCLENLNLAEFHLIDVREKSVFCLTPHIKGAINISSLEKLQEFCQCHKNKKILLTCNRGLEAAKYGTKLIEAGFDEIYFLDEYLQIIQDYLPIETP